MLPKSSPSSANVKLPSAIQALVPALLVLLTILAAGCDIANPELPTFTTTLNIPFERQEVLMADLVDEEELLFSDESGGLYVYLEGDSLRVQLDPDLSLDLNPQQSSFELGEISLESAEAGNFDFDLEEVYPDAGSLPPGTVVVPPFEFELNPEPRDLDGIRSAHVLSGALRAVIENDFQVPLSGEELPAMIRCEIFDTASGAGLAELNFPQEVPAGESATALFDLAGANLPDSVGVRILGGSPGHPGLDDLDPGRILNITVDIVDLIVDEALAEVGEQSISERRSMDLGDSLRIHEAIVASGVLEIELVNELSLPVQAELVLEEVFAPGGAPLSMILDLEPGATQTAQLDLQGARILAPEEDPLAALSYRVDVASPGSGEECVWIHASDRLSSSMSATAIQLAECRGLFPERLIELDPVIEELDLPDELAGVHFSQAILVLEILNEVEFPAELQLHLKSQYSGGDSLELNHVAQIQAADGRGAMLTRVVLDADNSIMPELLSGSPERIELSGQVRVGGEQVGTASPGQGAEIKWSVEAPLRATVEPTLIERDPFDLDLDEDLRETLEGRLYSGRLVAEIDNALPLDLELRFLVGADSSTVHSNPLREIGPFIVSAAPTDASGFVSESLLDDQELVLDREDVLALVGEGNYVAIAVDLPGTAGEEIAFRPADYLAIRGTLEAEVSSTEF